MTANRSHLYISELARLVGVSVKTVRHYHRAGLLSEPERADSGYRLYSTEHVRRLWTIRQLRQMGLSLNQIRTVFDAPDYERQLRAKLHELLDETEFKLRELRDYRKQIKGLLQRPSLTYDDLDGSSLYVKAAFEKLGHMLPEIDSAVIEQEMQLERIFSGYQWSENLEDYFTEVIAYFEQHPDLYRQYVEDSLDIIRQLQQSEIDESTLQALAQSMVARHATIFEFLLKKGESIRIPYAAVLGQLTEGVIPEIQRRFIALMAQAYEARLGEHNGTG